MRIVVDEDIPFIHEALVAHGIIISVPGRGLTRDRLSDADALFVRSVTRVDAALLEDTQVRFVGSATAGVDHVDLDWLAVRGITFAHAPGANAGAVAEHLAAALLALAADRGWTLSKMTFAVIGAGHVGSRVARLAGALGMSVLLNDPPLAEATGDARYRPIDEVTPRADVVSLHVPLTATGRHPTRRMVDAAWLRRMKRGAVLINMARGDVVDETALKSAMHCGALGGAVLDVWQNEPTPDPDLVRLADLSTPHVAGYSDDARIMATKTVYQAFCRWCDQQPEWRPPARSMLTIDAAGVAVDSSLEATLDAIVQIAFDIRGVSEAFKSAMTDETPVRAGAFEHLRRTHPRRVQFSGFSVRGLENLSAADIIARLGFDGSQHTVRNAAQ
ncbi:MAG: 4-phosphoerythronate dehydrogenase [Phycisphaerae bacterium]|nr:4-phosphoerythronate dehydrogenase [Phycisphaerae bacterium]